MPTPIELCIEDRTGAAARFTRCVALVGRQPGLRIDARGEIHWQQEDCAALELWISGDDRLMAYRLPDAPPICLHRGGRTFDLPAERPVVLLHRDELRMGERRLRLHIHGPTHGIQPPELVAERSRSSAGKLATAVAVGAVVVGCSESSELDVRENPPAPTTTTPTGSGGGGAGGAGGATGGAGGGGGIAGGGGMGTGGEQGGLGGAGGAGGAG